MAEEKTIPPLPYKSPLIDSRGFITTPWEKFLRQLFLRTGGNVALTNTELEALIASSGGDSTTIHDFTGGQGATNLTGETFDHNAYSSIYLVAEIYRGTTIEVTKLFALHYISGAWNVVDLIQGKRSSQTDPHGITFTMNGDQLRAAATAGDDGKIRLKKYRFPLTA